MKLPRMTTRRWMFAVAFLASFIAAVRALTRPIPVAQSVEIATGKVHWSDGVVARTGEVTRPVETEYVLFCRVVRWSDGSVSVRLP
jgi:hypothetical protein